MAIFCPDIIGSPSGSVLQQNIRSIVCQAPLAGNPLGVVRRDTTITSNPTGVFSHYAKHFHGIGTHVYET